MWFVHISLPPTYLYITYLPPPTFLGSSINLFFSTTRSYKFPPKSEVWGHDIDRSNEKVRLKELERLKAIGAIGSLTARWFPEMGKMKMKGWNPMQKMKVGFMVWEPGGVVWMVMMMEHSKSNQSSRSIKWICLSGNLSFHASKNSQRDMEAEWFGRCHWFSFWQWWIETVLTIRVWP